MQQRLNRPMRSDCQRGHYLSSWLVLVVLFYSMLAPTQLFAHEIIAVQTQPFTQEIRYHLAEAGEVFLVWGVNGWTIAAEELRPAGTVLKDTLLYTPMTRQGEAFVATLQVPAGTTIDYVFQITRTRDGTPIIPIFDTNGAPKKDFHTVVERSGVADAQPTVALATATVLHPLEIRYHLAEAGEVFLVWGVNDWTIAAEELRPAGTVLKDTLLYTPMTRQGEAFVATLQVPAGTTIDYVFQITRTRDGTPIIPIFDTNGAPKKDFHTVVERSGVADAQPTVALTQTPAIVDQEIRYHLAGAGEVFLVWGINDWKLAPETMRPAGTVVKGALMYTPMAQDGVNFVARLQLPATTTIDYVFEITKGQNGVITEIWDTNGQQDYHTVAGQMSVVDVQGAPQKAREASAPGILNYGLYALLGFGLVFGVTAVLKRRLPPGISSSRAVKGIGLSAMLGLFLVLMRAEVMGFTRSQPSNLLMLALETLLSSYYDIVYVLILAALFLCTMFLFRRHQPAQKAAYVGFVGLAVISLIIGISNVKVVEVLGRPFNYQWLYYSDFLGSLDAQSGIMSNISFMILLSVLGFCVAMLLAAQLAAEATGRLIKRFGSRQVPLISCCVGLIVYLGAANWYISKEQWSYFKLANPITSFVASMIAAGATPELFTMDLPRDLEAFPTPQDAVPNNVPVQIQPNKIRNVLLFVLESVPAAYIEAYGSPYSLTPELNAYRQHSLLFRNIYAHAPATNASLVSTLSSIYPWISYRNLTQEHPEINIPTLSAELKQRGYRTAFFSSGDMRFQRSDEFLSHRGFDAFQDYRTLPCEQQKFKSEINTWDFQDGADDQCTADALIDWIGHDSTEPFFGMLWTVQTHYPYFYNGEETDYGVDDQKFNRYLNALRHADAQLGRLLRELKSRGLDESTLVVVMGDHGEAFGQHDQYAHASNIYEENLHIPLLFINPALFHGEEAPTLGGTTDIAPSIMHILGLPTPDQWQGRSLFDTSQHKRIYFFAPWSSFRFGYREGDLKFIFDATNNTTELYDLRQDPDESNNLAEQRPETVTAGYQQLAAWIQFHDRYMKELLANEQQ